MQSHCMYEKVVSSLPSVPCKFPRNQCEDSVWMLVGIVQVRSRGMVAHYFFAVFC